MREALKLKVVGSSPPGLIRYYCDSLDVLLFAFLVFALWFPTVRQIAPFDPKGSNGAGNCPLFPNLEFKSIQSDSSNVLLFAFLVFALWFPTVRGIAPPSPKGSQRHPK